MELKLHYALQSNQAAIHFGIKGAVLWETVSALFPVAVSPQITIAQLMFMAAYRPAASQPAKVVGEFLGKKTGSVSGCTKALKMYTGVVSGSFGCVSFSKLCLWDAMKFFQVDWEQKSNNIKQYNT